MKKRVFLIAFTLLMLLGTTVCAAQADGVMPRASYYLDEYSIALNSEDDEVMCVSILVEGVGTQDKIGISYIDIEEKVGNRWSYVDTLEAADNSYFYEYDSDVYMDDVYFEGIPGVEYRVTVCVYAGKNGGSDTRTITSEPCVCR